MLFNVKNPGPGAPRKKELAPRYKFGQRGAGAEFFVDVFFSRGQRPKFSCNFVYKLLKSKEKLLESMDKPIKNMEKPLTMTLAKFILTVLTVFLNFLCTILKHVLESKR